MAPPCNNALILCAGLQSSGTTLVSYCFLQRADTDGVLDADNDLLPTIDPDLARPFAWYKSTISCFRLSEFAQHYRDEGWDVRTLLVLRDLREVWASLRNKSYGRNGITAEDPPLRLRVRRFIDDWRSTRAAAARHCATRISSHRRRPLFSGRVLSWVCRGTFSMLTWPKPQERIADRKNGNGSFWNNRDANLMLSLRRFREQRGQPRLPADDLHWLETEFRDYNEANCYPLSLDIAAETAPTLDGAGLDGPSFEVTRRYKWETAQRPFRWLLAQFGRKNSTLIDRRSWKRAA